MAVLLMAGIVNAQVTTEKTLGKTLKLRMEQEGLSYQKLAEINHDVPCTYCTIFMYVSEVPCSYVPYR